MRKPDPHALRATLEATGAFAGGGAPGWIVRRRRSRGLPPGKAMNAALGLLHLNAGDTVAIALRDFEAGEQLQVAGTEVVLREPVGSGHKVAVRAVPKGAPIVKYGVSIGTATTAIAPGEHVHTHNLESRRMRGDHQ